VAKGKVTMTPRDMCVCLAGAKSNSLPYHSDVGSMADVHPQLTERSSLLAKPKEIFVTSAYWYPFKVKTAHDFI
jgi:hypothetical protein